MAHRGQQCFRLSATEPSPIRLSCRVPAAMMRGNPSILQGNAKFGTGFPHIGAYVICYASARVV
jgi:hypothetical protein